jgi:hypothetical protein
MGPDRPVARALHVWREAERTLAQSEPGSKEYLEACAALEAARLVYLSAVERRSDLAAEFDHLWADEGYRRPGSGPADGGRVVERGSQSGD